MGYEPRRSGRAYGTSVLIGAYLPVTLLLLVGAWSEPNVLSEFWAIPVVILVYGIFALPFVALGLAVFGLPLTILFRRRAQDWWVGLVAALWGAVAGKLMFYGIDHLMFFGFYDIGKVTLADAGIIFGMTTGIAWWVLYRREIAND